MEAPNRGARLLREWRRANNLTQFRAAVHLDVDPSPLSALERGKKKPGRVIAVRIAERTDGAVPVDAWDVAELEGAAAPATE